MLSLVIEEKQFCSAFIAEAETKITLCRYKTSTSVVCWQIPMNKCHRKARQTRMSGKNVLSFIAVHNQRMNEKRI